MSADKLSLLAPPPCDEYGVNEHLMPRRAARLAQYPAYKQIRI